MSEWRWENPRLSRSSEPEGPPKRPRLLVVEQDAATIEVLRSVMEFVEWDLVVAATADDCACHFDPLDPPPSAVLIHAPETTADWEQVVALARSSTLPVRIGLAVMDRVDMPDQATLLGVDHIFVKPIDMDEILEWLAIET